MLKISISKNLNNISNSLLKDVNGLKPKLVEAFSKEVQKSAQKNFDMATNEISGDNPYVVVSRSVSKDTAKVVCAGEQVLFAEFGAGINNSFNERTFEVGEYTRVSSKGTIYRVKSYDRTIVFSAKGFSNGGMTERAPRPPRIVELGQYGKKQGMNKMWVRPTANGRMGSNDLNYVHNRTDAIWTRGTRPVRGLWRAVNSAKRKLEGGRLVIK